MIMITSTKEVVTVESIDENDMATGHFASQAMFRIPLRRLTADKEGMEHIARLIGANEVILI